LENDRTNDQDKNTNTNIINNPNKENNKILNKIHDNDLFDLLNSLKNAGIDIAEEKESEENNNLCKNDLFTKSVVNMDTINNTVVTGKWKQIEKDDIVEHFELKNEIDSIYLRLILKEKSDIEKRGKYHYNGMNLIHHVLSSEAVKNKNVYYTK